MLRLASRVPFAATQLRCVRSYSEGFDLSQYLNRIEAISKTKPAPRQPKARPNFQAQTNQPRSKKPQNLQQQSKEPRSTRRTPNNTSDNRISAKSPNRVNSGSASKQNTERSATRSSSTKPAVFAKRQAAPPKTTENKEGSKHTQSHEGDDWSTLSSVEASSKPAGRQMRRSNFRKPGSKAKPSVKARASRSKPAERKRKTEPKVTTEYQPFLTPDEGLAVVFRNEGTTSGGGFIGPYDVSLASLQPNFVQSSVSYDSRIRSLLNAASPSVKQDRQQLEDLVNKYVSGSYSEIAAGKSLSSQGLANTLNANRTMISTQKEFFAKVAAGKISPKQIAARA